MPIVLTSCGVINEDFKEKFFGLFQKPTEELRMLYITTAADGESGDKSWVDEEYQRILALGFRSENIVEYKIGSSLENLHDFDLIYMLGGNTFYLMKMIRESGFEGQLREAIDSGIVYVGSSAGSVIMGTTLEPAAVYGDEIIDEVGTEGLKFVDAAVIPHMNQKTEDYEAWMETWNGKTFLLYDGDGMII